MSDEYVELCRVNRELHEDNERLRARVAELNTSYAHIFRDNEVLHAQHEALMAAAKAADIYFYGYAQDEADEDAACSRGQQFAARELRDALAALRATGIDLEEKT